MSELNATIEWIKAVSDNLDDLRKQTQDAHGSCEKSMGDRVDAVRQEVKGLENDVNNINDTTDKHKIYHRKNEHKWGIPKFIKNHVVVCLGIALLLGVILTGIFGVTIQKVLHMYNDVVNISNMKPIHAPYTVSSDSTSINKD